MTATQTQPNTKTKADTITRVSAKIQTAVTAWATAESSSLWTLVREVHTAIHTDDLTETEVRAAVVGAMKVTYGDAGVRSRQGHISKIMTIGKKALPEDLARFKKEKIGFYKAWEEFSTKQVNPAPKSTTTTETTGTTQPEPENKSWTSPTMGGEVDVTSPPIQTTTTTGKTREQRKEEKSQDTTETRIQRLIEAVSKRESYWNDFNRATAHIVSPPMILDFFRDYYQQNPKQAARLMGYILDGDSYYRNQAQTYFEDREVPVVMEDMAPAPETQPDPQPETQPESTDANNGHTSQA